jgi:hypothetical protein
MGGVDVADAGHALVDQVDGLAPERGPEAVGHVPRHLAPDLDGHLADTVGSLRLHDRTPIA